MKFQNQNNRDQKTGETRMENARPFQVNDDDYEDEIDQCDESGDGEDGGAEDENSNHEDENQDEPDLTLNSLTQHHDRHVRRIGSSAN